MDEEASSDMQKNLSDGPMETDEGPLINENSNGLSHLLTEGEFNSVDAAVDESSTSNQGFLNAVELSTGSVGDYLESNAAGFEGGSFDVGDNAVNFPSDSLNNELNESDSLFSNTAFKQPDNDGDVNKHNIDTDFDISESDASCPVPTEDTNPKTETEDENTTDLTITEEAIVISDNKSPSPDVEMITGGETKADEPAAINSETNEPKTDETIESQQPADTAAPVIEIIDDSSTNQHDVSMEAEAPAIAEAPANAEAVEEVATKNEDSDKNAEATDNEKQVVPEATEQSQEAIDKNLKGSAEETEVVSEDELPELQQASVQDAENVSDDELPAPPPHDLPHDTEVVSEDELPAAKKEGEGADSRKRKPDDDEPADSAHDGEAKKQALAKNGESKPVAAEKRSSSEEKPKKKLPELEKYWKVVNDDPSDFTGWTYLLQYVDQESDVEAARAAYDAFLAHYPYCYGYWRKYADYEKRKGTKKKCLEVLERGLKAIPLSVDLWIHFLNHIKATRAEDIAYIRSQYERAVEACGLEFRSDRLWESYLKWEAEHGAPLHVTAIYDRLLATPTLGYTAHFDNFQEHVMSEPVSGVVSRAELVRLRQEVREGAPAAPPTDLPPGEDEPPDHIASEEEAAAIKERIIAARRKLHKTTGEQVAARWTYEEGIKRPYFHVKPLERCQLKNWKSYLEWEKAHGGLQRALVLHERCLIACALYDDFWMRLIKYLDEQAGEHPELVERQRDVFTRACTVHHPDKPELHLAWAHFEELHGRADAARHILQRIEKVCPDLVIIHYRRVNLERRAGALDACCSLYESYISGAKSRAVASALSVKYARLLVHARAEHAAARAVLDRALARDPLNHRLHLQRLDLALHTPGTTYDELDELAQSYGAQEGAEAEVCCALAAMRAQLAEERGSAAHAADAHRHARALAAALRKRARQAKHDAAAAHTAPPETKKKESTTSNSSSAATSGAAAGAGAGAGAYYGAGAGAGAGAAAAAGHYEQGYGAPYQPPPWGYQAPPPPYHHPHTHAPWTHYTNYY